jgi:hypothetical protein
VRVTLSNNDDKQRFTLVSHPTCQIVTVLGWQGFLGKRSTCIIRQRELATMFQMRRTGPLRARDRCSDSRLRNKWPARIHKRSPCVLAECQCCNYVYFLCQVFTSKMSRLSCLAASLSNGSFKRQNTSARPCTPRPTGLCLMLLLWADGTC